MLSMLENMGLLHRFGLLIFAFVMASPAHSQHSRLQDGREFIQMDRAPPGLMWVVQVSDLHVSSYHPDRAQAMEIFLGPLLAFINPALVLITGDLTDAKSKDRRSRRQDEAEWVQYSESIGKVIEDSGLPQYAFYDLRGNHDKFGVPEVGGKLDYFSKYSVSAQNNRTSTVQSVTLMNRGWKHVFVGIDDSMGVGLGGPCNLFGHPTDQQLQKVDLELSQWDAQSPEKVTKVVFGHFPMSFTASSETRERPEAVYTKHSISAYICGHLHANFGPNLFRHHQHYPSRYGSPKSGDSGGEDKSGEFWEWEVGDWRMRRIVRILAFDEGHTSFVDVDFFNLNASNHDAKNQLPTLVIPTYPLDSQKMQRLKPLPFSSSAQDSVRALVFSSEPLVSVVARFFDTITEQLVLLEELEMHVLSKTGHTGYLYVSKWNSTKYIDWSPRRYMLQIVVVNLEGKETCSSLRPFSVNNRIDKLKLKWSEFFVMGFNWDEIFPILLWSGLTSLVALFILPKFYFHFLVRSGYYSRWIFSLFHANSKQKFTAQKAVDFVLWFFIQGCGNGMIWWGQSLMLTYLIFFPWFWGQVLAEGYPIGHMSLRGWTIHTGGTKSSHYGLGWPDLMVVVLPYIYFVLFPLFTLIFALSAERSLCELRALDAPANLKKKERSDDQDSKQSLSSSKTGWDLGENGQKNLSNNIILNGPESKILDLGVQNEHGGTRWFRIITMGGCVWISCVHFGQACALGGAYGTVALLASPGFAWPVPLLMIAAILQTKPFRRRK